MILAVASGKGGTGKTTFAANLAYYLSRHMDITVMDLDVEEPNVGLYLHPSQMAANPVYKRVPEVNYDRCSFCGKCTDLCVYNALVVLKKDVLVFNELCHSCGVCSYFCPQNAIAYTDYQIGTISEAQMPGIHFVEGRLDVGEVAAPEVIKTVKHHIVPASTTILDAPPGTSCSVVEAIHSVDFCLLIAEPTLFGLSDLKLITALLEDQSIPAGIIINQDDADCTIIDDYAREINIPILGRIAFSFEIAACGSEGIPFLSRMPEYEQLFASILPRAEELMKR